MEETLLKDGSHSFMAPVKATVGEIRAILVQADIIKKRLSESIDVIEAYANLLKLIPADKKVASHAEKITDYCEELKMVKTRTDFISHALNAMKENVLPF